MKKVLVTGAGGLVGAQVISFLLTEGKYEVTALDFKTKNVYNRLKKFKKRIDIVFGDVNDNAIVDALVKDMDVVIHLASVMPPFANLRDDLSSRIEVDGTKVIVDAIRNYNKDCFLLYASSTSVYGEHKDSTLLTVKTTSNIDCYDFYSKNKLECEKYIRKYLDNYAIFRLSYIVGCNKCSSLIYNVNPNCLIEPLLCRDASYAFVAAIDKKSKVNKKTFNVTSGEKYRTSYYEYINKVLESNGISFAFLHSLLFEDRNLYGGYYGDSDELDKILHFRCDEECKVFEPSKCKIMRCIPKLFAKPFIKSNLKKINRKEC